MTPHWLAQRLTSAVAGMAAALALFTAAPAFASSQLGLASWYQVGKQTANGEPYNPNGLTAAHRTLPFGSRVRVTNLKTGQSIVVRINDRGPFIKTRIIDLSRGAASFIGLKKSGIAPVRVDILERG